jgi:hypothetical protein
MELAIIIITGVAGLFIFSMSRGKKAVRAFIYLTSRADGATVSEANDLASRIDTHRASELNTAMLHFVRHAYGGKQLPMISDARLDGFRE